jgi:hypothetical protein
LDTGIAVYSAASGDATSFGPEGRYHFGSPGLLYIPLIGPSLFDQDFCSEARDYFRTHASHGIDSLEYCGSGGLVSWFTVSTLPQLLGAGLIGLSFAFPQRRTLTQPSPSKNVYPGLRVDRSAALFELSGNF